MCTSEHSDAAILPPTTLRVALSLLLDNRGGSKFRLKEMSDAEEALDEILKYLHCQAAKLRRAEGRQWGAEPASSSVG